jgi:hypothetical protein
MAMIWARDLPSAFIRCRSPDKAFKEYSIQSLLPPDALIRINIRQPHPSWARAGAARRIDGAVDQQQLEGVFPCARRPEAGTVKTVAVGEISGANFFSWCPLCVGGSSFL